MEVEVVAGKPEKSEEDEAAVALAAFDNALDLWFPEEEVGPIYVACLTLHGCPSFIFSIDASVVNT